MLRVMITAALVAVGLWASAPDAAAQYRFRQARPVAPYSTQYRYSQPLPAAPYTSQYPYSQPPPSPYYEGGNYQRYHVQIRQPNWKTTSFSSEYAMRDFADDKRHHGWEVRVRSMGYDSYEVDYRLLRWGGTRYGVAENLEEARSQAQQMEYEGYETQILPR